MADNFDSWPDVTDDDGSLTVGTPFSSAYDAAVRASLADNLYSSTNPTIKAKALIDEVVTARGSASSLDERLDVALEEDGTPKAVAGQASESQLALQLGSTNLVRNAQFARWSKGNAAAPDHWVSSGGTPTIARAGAGESDTTHLDVGMFTLKLSSDASTETFMTQSLLSAALVTLYPTLLRSRKIQVSCWVQASVGSVAWLSVTDGVTATASSYHTGSGNPELLTFEHTISATATKLQLLLRVVGGTNTAFFGLPQVFYGDVGLSAVQPEPLIWNSPRRITLASFTNGSDEDFYSVTSGSEEDAWTMPGGIPAAAVAEGQSIALRFVVELAANTNSKIVKVYVGSTAISIIAATTTATDLYATFDILLTRVANTKCAVTGYGGYLGATGAAGSNFVYPFGTSSYLATVDWTANQDLKIALDGVASADMILRSGGIVEYVP